MKRQLKIILAILLTITFSAWGDQATELPPAEGVVLEVQGQAVIEDIHGESRKLKKHAIVYGGETVETMLDTFVRIVLVDESTLEIHSNTRLQINDSRMNPHGSSSIVLFVGWLWAKVTARSIEGYAFEVEGPTTVAGVRGTSFSIGVAEDGSMRVGVKEGRVDIDSDDGQVRVPRGQTADIDLEGRVKLLVMLLHGPEQWMIWLGERRDSLFEELGAILGLLIQGAGESRTEATKRVETTNQAYNDYEAVLARLEQSIQEDEELVAHEKPQEQPEEKPKEKPEVKKEEKKERELSPEQKSRLASASRRVFMEGRALQAADNRTVNNARLAKNIKKLAKREPAKFTPEQLAEINKTAKRLEAMRVDPFHKQMTLGMSRYSMAMESDLMRWNMSSSLARPSMLDKNIQVNRVLRSVGVIIKDMPEPKMIRMPSIPRIRPVMP